MLKLEEKKVSNGHWCVQVFLKYEFIFYLFRLGAAKLMLLCDVFLKCPQIGRKNLIKYPTNSYVCCNMTWEEVFLTFVNVRFVRVQQRRCLSSVPLLSGRVVYLVPSVLMSHQSDVWLGFWALFKERYHFPNSFSFRALFMRVTSDGGTTAVLQRYGCNCWSQTLFTNVGSSTNIGAGWVDGWLIT